MQSLPLLSVRAGPRDGEQWIARLKQELHALIAYVNMNKKSDNDWFFIEPNKLGTKSAAGQHRRPQQPLRQCGLTGSFWFTRASAARSRHLTLPTHTAAAAVLYSLTDQVDGQMLVHP